MTVLSHEDIIGELLALDPELRIEPYYAERSVFYNPGHAAPLGAIFASLKDHDGPNDVASRLSRPGVHRFAFQLAPDAFARRFGVVPPRPRRGAVVELEADPAALNRLTPHPIYAWMRWVQILSPSAQQFAALRPELEQSLDGVRSRWLRRRHDQGVGGPRRHEAARDTAPPRPRSGASTPAAGHGEHATTRDVPDSLS